MFQPNFNQTPKQDYNSYTPIAKGIHKVTISEAELDEGVSGMNSKYPNAPRSMIKLKFDVFGAAQDGGSRPMFDNLIIAHKATEQDEKMRGFVEQNGQKFTDLLLQIISLKYGGNASSSPFAGGITASNIGHLVDGSVLSLDIDVKTNRQSGDKENVIKSYYPIDSAPQQGQTQPMQAQQPAQQQPMQQAPMGNGQAQNYAPNANTQSQPVNASPSNNNGMPPFMQPQQQASGQN